MYLPRIYPLHREAVALPVVLVFLVRLRHASGVSPMHRNEVIEGNPECPFPMIPPATTPSISKLPLELLDEIARYAASGTQLSLSRVSKSFHSLSIRYLYRRILLISLDSVLRCCQTLSAKPSVAQTVRYLEITPEYASFISQLVGTLK